MGDDKNRTPLIPISGVLVILAALGVTIFTQPFKGARPPAPDYRECHTKVNARLWQDPFQAVLDGVEGRESLSPCEFNILQGASLIAPKKSCRAPVGGVEDHGKLTVLGVMVPGAPYVEDGEKRMRYRYALLSGLGRLGYVPEDSEHIEFMKILTDGEPESYTLSNVMPMERLASSKPGAEGNRILVLWINDTVFEKEPLKKIDRLVEYLGFPFKSQEVGLKIIGPARSETLRGMLREAWNKARKAGAQRYNIYSAMATVDDRTLLRDVVCEGNPKGGECTDVRRMSDAEARDKIEKKFDAAGIGLIRTIGADKELTHNLVDELKLRNLDLMDDKAQILLVAEWDTYYGRSFEKAFRERIYDGLKEKTGPSLSETERRMALTSAFGRIRRISYLRGIDGRLPGEKEEKKDGQKDEKSQVQNDVSKGAKKLEQAVGKSQYDYLRRLSEEVGRINDDLRHRGKGEIRAVGVMGTDFYDKYLVLQALRQKFSDAIYFTTDMDARYLHSDNIEWTRNLLVASNFNLSLRNDDKVGIQGEIPPFRDSYQTSIFFAVLRAFSGEICPPGAIGCPAARYLSEDIEFLRTPMIFEIGHGSAVLLTDPGDSIHPLRGQPYWGDWKVYAVLALATAFLILTSTYLNRMVKRSVIHVKRLVRAKQLDYAEKSDHRSTTYRIGAFTATVTTVVGVALLINWVSGLDGEEPFSISEGISVWPTEILRMTAIALSWIFFYRAYTSRKESTERIAKRFHVDAKTASESPHSGRPGEGWVSNVLGLGWEPERPEDRSLKEVWQEYRDHDKGSYRFWRVTIAATLYLGFCWLIIAFDPPVSPVRGLKSLLVDRCTLAVCVVSFVILVSYVFDVTSCCRRFIAIATEAFANKSGPQTDSEIRDRITEGLELIRLIAARTAVIGKFLFYPFIVWLIMIFSRFTYFDNWRAPVGLVVVMSLAAAYAWASAFLLRLGAEKARARVMDWCQRLQSATLLSNQTANMRKVGQLEYAMQEIRSIREGAFASLSQHPLLHVLFVAFGGLGGMFGLDLLSKLNL